MQRSFLNIFLLALAISMGTTLFSCKRATGEPALVGDVAVVDSAAIDTTTQMYGKPVGSRAGNTTESPAPDYSIMGMAAPRQKHLKGDTVAEPVKGKVKVSE